MPEEFARIAGTVTIGESVAVAGAKPTRAIDFTFGAVDVPSENGDIVPREEVEAVTDHLVAQGIDLLHEFGLTIGAFRSPLKFHERDGKTFFGGDGNLWEWRYPTEIAAVVAAHGKSQVAGSMEMGFAKGECTECDHIFPGNSAYSTFWEHRDRQHEGKSYRRLRGLDPRGAGIVLTDRERPAFEGTQILALASVRSSEVSKMGDQDKDRKGGQDGEDGAKGDKGAPESADVAVAYGKLQQQFEELEKTHKAVVAEKDQLGVKVAELEITLKAGDRIGALTATLKEKAGEAFELTGDLLDRVKARAGKLADDAWSQFAEDCAALIQAPTKLATASKKKSNDAPPAGGSPAPDDDGKPKDALAATRTALGGILAVSTVSRKTKEEEDDDA